MTLATPPVKAFLPDYHEEQRVVDGRPITVLVCDECGGLRVPGDWPDCRKDGSHTPGNFGEEPLEPYVDRNVDTVPRKITTRAERRRLMNKNNLEYVPKERRLHAVAYFDMRGSR